MLKTLTTILLILLSVISIAVANNKEGNVMSTEEKNVLNVIKKMTTSFHNGDIEGVMASYEKNASVVFEPGKPVSDPTILRKMFKETFTLNPKFSYSGHEVFISNDIAVHYAPWTMKGKAPDGTVVEQSGLSVAVLRRQLDGKWLMVIDNPHGQNLMSQ
jgi:ketosteroid isomerase-like protein